MDRDGEESDDSDELLNEEAPDGIDPEFANNVLATKHALYDKIVLAPNIDDEESQNNELLDNYVKHINKVYVLAVVSQNGKKNARNMDEFPEGARENIQTMLEWLETFFSKNHIPSTIPYTHYVKHHFYVYPYIQNNSFMNEE